MLETDPSGRALSRDLKRVKEKTRYAANPASPSVVLGITSCRWGPRAGGYSFVLLLSNTKSQMFVTQLLSAGRQQNWNGKNLNMFYAPDQARQKR